jgi:hypothetical protein
MCRQVAVDAHQRLSLIDNYGKVLIEFLALFALTESIILQFGLREPIKFA